MRCQHNAHANLSHALNICDRASQSVISAPRLSHRLCCTTITNCTFAIRSTRHFLVIFERYTRSGISFGIGVDHCVCCFLRSAPPSLNFIIHGNLPYKLPVYGEDIQCLFKRTQRVNWYGRVIFGIVANLSMTHDQLTDVRKYWLGRVIAFDSLRRQRQNQLATMHLQLAAKAKVGRS